MDFTRCLNVCCCIWYLDPSYRSLKSGNWVGHPWLHIVSIISHRCSVGLRSGEVVDQINTLIFVSSRMSVLFGHYCLMVCKALDHECFKNGHIMLVADHCRPGDPHKSCSFELALSHSSNHHSVTVFKITHILTPSHLPASSTLALRRTCSFAAPKKVSTDSFYSKEMLQLVIYAQGRKPLLHGLYTLTWKLMK